MIIKKPAITASDIQDILTHAKIDLRKVTETMMEQLAEDVQLLALDHFQRGPQYRQKGRKVQTPEFYLNSVVESFVIALEGEILNRKNLADHLIQFKYDEDANFVLSQVEQISKVVEDVLALKKCVFPIVLEQMEESWGADALIIYQSFCRCLGYGSMSKNGPACRFTSLTLKRIGWPGELSPASVEQALSRRSPR